MPYKNKEDRAEAVRRHREKKRGIREAMIWEGEFKDFLRKISLGSFPWDDFVEVAQEFTKDEQGIWRCKDGTRIHPPEEVYFIVNTLVIW